MKKLQEQAIEILKKNWRGGFTVPTDKLYPFQWNWDSGFVMLGQQYYDLENAISELRSMLSGQWKNGMLPHIIFHSEAETTYFPNFDFWNSEVNEGAPSKPKTSGITQPPVFGFILKELWNKHKDNASFIDFCYEAIPKIIDFHFFFYNYRDPNKEGLLHIIHPWESGRDNSPLWDEAMNKISIVKSELPNYTRRDTSIADPSERPTTDQYDRYVYLLEYAKNHHYDGEALMTQCPFMIQDTMMNALLIKSNEDILFLCDKLGIETKGLEEKQKLSKENYHKKLWKTDLKWHCCYDLKNDKYIEHKEIGALATLFAGFIDPQTASIYNNYLTDLHKRDYYLCPSFDVESEFFDSKRYWRGPIWPQMNWLIAKGLDSFNYNKTAELVKNDLIELVSAHGFYEYFEAQKSVAKSIQSGYGGNQFSWTASCILNLINEE